MNKNTKTKEVLYFTIKYLLAVVIGVIALFAVVQSTLAQDVSSRSTSRTYRWQPIQTITTCESITKIETITAKLDVSHILNKLTRQEADNLRKFFTAQVWCWEYPTHTQQVRLPDQVVCKDYTTPYCWDNKINTPTEECDWSIWCDLDCKLYRPTLPTEPIYAPVYRQNELAPAWASVDCNEVARKWWSC